MPFYPLLFATYNEMMHYAFLIHPFNAVEQPQNKNLFSLIAAINSSSPASLFINNFFWGGCTSQTLLFYKETTHTKVSPLL